MAQENDIVLIYFEDQPAGFARIEAIAPDVKKDWYHVKLLLLQVPLQTVTWILRDVYINGEEFTMGGNRMRLEKVEAPPEAEPEPQQEETKETPTKDERKTDKDAKVVALWDHDKKK
ncbi:MAG: hypothetical protein KGY61_14295 [Desulfobacterales bacterium]|nr:hypothetical protein [Desulfobacterales bacterium]